MKKLILILVLAAFIGCQKEQTCNCGLIVNDGTDGCYWVEIRNDCTKNVKRFCLTKGDWMNAHAGSNYCITNSNGW
jgi:hypothetical protein